jgi:hypothetical protein
LEGAREHAEGEGRLKVQGKTFGDYGGEKKEPVEELFNRANISLFSSPLP